MILLQNLGRGGRSGFCNLLNDGMLEEQGSSHVVVPECLGELVSCKFRSLP